MTYKKINQSESKLEYDIEEARKILAQQNKKLYALEICLQKEQREKADLLTDYQHLLDQIKLTKKLNL